MLLVLAACGGGSRPASRGTPRPSPTSTTFTEPEWTITTPAGWTKRDVTSEADAKKAIRYGAVSGEYFIVHIDPQGSDFRYDTLWRYDVKGSGFEVVDKYECKAAPADESCSDDDVRYDGFVLWKTSADPPKLGGHTWYFAFGNLYDTTIDASLFEQIVESIRVTG